MKRALVLLLVLGGVAEASELVKPPAGWKTDPEQATALAAKANGLSHFGGARAMATSDVFLPEKPGVALFVTAVAAKVPTDREVAARVEIDELHATSQRAALAGSGILEDGWQEKVDPAAKQLEATLAWHDGGAHTQTFSRIVIAGDTDNLVAVTGECVAADDADARALADCKAALATLDPGIDPAKRAALSLAPAGTRPAEPPPSPTAGPAPMMSDGSRAPMPPIVVPTEKPATDRRPVYVGLGIVILAAAFWWNQRRRARFDPESEKDADE